MALQNPGLLVQGELSQSITKMFSELTAYRFFPILRNPNKMIPALCSAERYVECPSYLFEFYKSTIGGLHIIFKDKPPWRPCGSPLNPQTKGGFFGHGDIRSSGIRARANIEMKRAALEKAAEGRNSSTLPSWKDNNRSINWLRSL
jgi:hypothetical protein